MIAAMANDRVIGADNAMPWHLPADLKHFKATTMGKPVVMGRKTYQSIGKALPGRLNIVVSRSGIQLQDAVVVDSIDSAIAAAGNVEEVMVIGGGAIYQACLEQCNRLYLTYIDADLDGDTRFPDYNDGYSWRELSSEAHNADVKNPYGYRFVTLEKV